MILKVGAVALITIAVGIFASDLWFAVGIPVFSVALDGLVGIIRHRP